MNISTLIMAQNNNSLVTLDYDYIRLEEFEKLQKEVQKLKKQIKKKRRWQKHDRL